MIANEDSGEYIETKGREKDLVPAYTVYARAYIVGKIFSYARRDMKIIFLKIY